jgi:hypothetical protein
MHPREQVLNQIHFCLRHDITIPAPLVESAEKIGVDLNELKMSHIATKETEHGKPKQNIFHDTAWTRTLRVADKA